MDVETAPKVSSLKTTFAIPSSLSHTKKLGETAEAPKEKEEKDLPIPPVPETGSTLAVPLTQDLLDQALLTIREQYRSANKNLELAILDQEIHFNEGELLIRITGSIQEDIATKMKPELMALLRQHTGANDFSLTLAQREEVEDEKRMLYTSTDKLKFLREKHPALMELQRKFDLDVDF